MSASYRILLNPAAVEETTTAPPAPTPAPPPPSPAPEPKPMADTSDAFKRLLAKHNDDAIRLSQTLYDENHSYREKLRELQAKVPGEKAVILKEDEAKLWEAYRKLGAPEDLLKVQAERETLQGEVAKFARAKQLGAVAEAAGVKPVVLERLAPADLEFEVKEELKAGKLVRSVFVKGEDAEGRPTLVPFSDHAAKHWAEFLPALRADAAQASRPIGTPPRAAGTPPPAAASGAARPRRNALS